MTYQMENLKLEKVKANSNFCRVQNNLLLLTEGYELPSRKEILDALETWTNGLKALLKYCTLNQTCISKAVSLKRAT